MSLQFYKINNCLSALESKHHAEAYVVYRSLRREYYTHPKICLMLTSVHDWFNGICSRKYAQVKTSIAIFGEGETKTA